MPDHTSASVAKALDSVQALCGPMFERVCGTILADRGSEFADAERIEHGRNGMRRCSLYYCDPLRSNQKGGCEKNTTEPKAYYRLVGQAARAVSPASLVWLRKIVLGTDVVLPPGPQASAYH